MALACPRCGAVVGDEELHCSACGSELDPGGTILPPGPKANNPARSPSTSRPAKRPERPSRASSPESGAISPVKARPRPAPPAAAAPPPVSQPAPPPPPPSLPAYPPQQVRPPESYPAPYYHAPAVGQAPQGNPGGVRGWMIRLLGGTAEPAPPQSPQAVPFPAAAPYPPYPPPYPSPPSGYYPPAPAVPDPWVPQPPAPPQAPRQVPFPPRAPEPPSPSGEFSTPFGEGDDDGKTRFVGGVDLDKLKIPKSTLTLQILDSNAQWRDWGPIHAHGMNVGRAKNSADFPGLSSMAVRHMKFSYDRTNLTVEDLGSLNGIYLRVVEPVELVDGMRFRIGNQTFEFHQAEPFDPVPPKVADDGEEYCSRDLEPLAFVDLIRPDGRPGLRFPITRPDVTVIGREGPGIQITLSGDISVSGTHAQLRRDDGRFFLDDLNSRNGTYVHILGSRVVRSGDVLLAGKVLFRVIDPSGS